MNTDEARQLRLIKRLDTALASENARCPSSDIEAIGRLVGKVKAHIAAVSQDADPTWADALRSPWAELEYIYALSLDQGRTTLPPEELSAIKETLARLRALVAAPTTAHEELTELRV